MSIRRLQELAGVRSTRTSLVPWDLQMEAGVTGYYNKYAMANWKKKQSQYKLGIPSSGPRYKQMIQKGYLDFGDADVNATHTIESPGGFISLSGRNLAAILIAKDGVAYARDPEDVVTKVMGSKNPIKTLEDETRIGVIDNYETLRARASEDGDFDEESKWLSAIKDVEKANINVTKVQGKTGAGYKVTMSPTPSMINKKHGVHF